jgi:hypothetical protein
MKLAVSCRESLSFAAGRVPTALLVALAIIAFALPPGRTAAAEVFDLGYSASLLDLPEPAFWTPDGSSIATSDGPQAVFTNPAAIGLRSGFGFFYGGTNVGEKSTRGAFSLQFGDVAFGYTEFKRRSSAGTRSLVGESFSIRKMLKVGMFGNWQAEYRVAGVRKDLDAFSYGAGLLFRPCSRFSLGAKLSNLNQPKLGEDVLLRYYHVGAGVRPLGNRVTLTVDTEFEEGAEGDDMGVRFGVELEPLDGLLLHAGYMDRDGEADVRFAVGFSLPQFSFGYSGETRGDDMREERAGHYVSTTTELQRSLIKPKSKVGRRQGNLRPGIRRHVHAEVQPRPSAVLEDLRRAQAVGEGILLDIGASATWRSSKAA